MNITISGDRTLWTAIFLSLSSFSDDVDNTLAAIWDRNCFDILSPKYDRMLLIIIHLNYLIFNFWSLFLMKFCSKMPLRVSLKPGITAENWVNLKIKNSVKWQKGKFWIKFENSNPIIGIFGQNSQKCTWKLQNLESMGKNLLKGQNSMYEKLWDHELYLFWLA